MKKRATVVKSKIAPAAKPAASRAASKLKPLAEGQIWRVAGMNLRVGLVGKMLVHYKLAKPDAVRIPNSVSGKSAVEGYLKKNKAVLIEG